jgi:predicted Zn-dependent protease
MKKNMGVQILLNVALGNDSQIGQVLAGLQSLKFSRTDESEADEYSVRYLCGTKYEASGAAGFFEKIEAQGGSSVPEFMSTHPNPGNRVADIKAKDQELNCAGDVTTGDYAQFKRDLGLTSAE